MKWELCYRHLYITKAIIYSLKSQYSSYNNSLHTNLLLCILLSQSRRTIFKKMSVLIWENVLDKMRLIWLKAVCFHWVADICSVLWLCIYLVSAATAHRGRGGCLTSPQTMWESQVFESVCVTTGRNTHLCWFFWRRENWSWLQSVTSELDGLFIVFWRSGCDMLCVCGFV